MRPQDTSSRELTVKLEAMYQDLQKQIPEENNIVQELYHMWLGGIDSDKCSAMLHTQYQAVDKVATSLNIKW